MPPSTRLSVRPAVLFRASAIVALAVLLAQLGRGLGVERALVTAAALGGAVHLGLLVALVVARRLAAQASGPTRSEAPTPEASPEAAAAALPA